MTHPNVEAKLWEEQTYVKPNFLLQQNLERAERCRQQMLFIHVGVRSDTIFVKSFRLADLNVCPDTVCLRSIQRGR